MRSADFLKGLTGQPAKPNREQLHRQAIKAMSRDEVIQRTSNFILQRAEAGLELLLNTEAGSDAMAFYVANTNALSNVLDGAHADEEVKDATLKAVAQSIVAAIAFGYELGKGATA